MDLQELKENFEMLDNWEDKYSYIIDRGKNLPAVANDLQVEENLVQGCMSQVWLKTKIKNDTLVFDAISDSTIINGLIAILHVIYDNKTTAQVKEIDIEKIFNDLDLQEHISSNRRNGFFAMVEKIKIAGL
jgi:cysteine desulfuration protein SufE